MPHLHQTRVGIRRLRSSFSLFRPLLRDVPGAFLVAHRLRALALPFGPARDLDVLLSGPLVDDLDAAQVDRLRPTARRPTTRCTPSCAPPTGRMPRAPSTASSSSRRGRVSPTRRCASWPRRRWRSGGTGSSGTSTASPRWRRRSGTGCASRPRSCATAASSSPRCTPSTRCASSPTAGEELAGPLAFAWHVEQVQTALGAVNDHATADGLLRSVGAAAPAVDEHRLVGGGRRRGARPRGARPVLALTGDAPRGGA